MEHRITSIVFVTGHLAPRIKQHVQERHPDLAAQFVLNEQFATTNTGYSLMLAQRAIDGDDFIKLDGDVVFEPEILTRLLQTHGNGIVVDRSVALGDEEVKVTLGSEGRIQKIGKDVPVASAAGESIGIEKITSDLVKPLFTALEQLFLKEKRMNEYYERAYDRLIADGVLFQAVDIAGLRWNEIDDKIDLDRARELFA